MKPIIINFDYSKTSSLYIQLYEYIKGEILKGNMNVGEKLPSLRSLSKDLGISVTTTELAYNQLLVEGYIYSKPQSGYFVSAIESSSAESNPKDNASIYDISDFTLEAPPYIYDLSCFDFNKWKKCSASVFNEFSHLLLFESDPQGEAALRYEISKYIYKSRGVITVPARIVIGAGTQQITGHLSRILLKMGISHVALEAPGYLPVQSMFRDGGFTISHIPVSSDGIIIDKLPANISSAVYVSPSNQFPTGAVMPIGRRYRLLEWADANDSIVIEDDYDSELRYFGKPVPALQGLDSNNRVVYLGSFSSTLFPAIKISYMVLPENMIEIFNKIKDQYTQTCSKAEQLTLALFMEKGYYYTGIRKLRSLYAQKLQICLQALAKYGSGLVSPLDTQSGISLTLKIKSGKNSENLCRDAAKLGIEMIPLSEVSDQDISGVIFYYNQLPLSKIDSMIESLVKEWKTHS